MKNFMIFSLIVAAVTAFATEPVFIAPQSELPKETVPPLKVEPSSRSFFYLKMGASDSHPTNPEKITPGIGVGFRLNSIQSALDFSANYASGRGIKGGKRAYYYAAPKVSYLRYLDPLSNQSFYGGVGLAWGGLRTKQDREFQGIVPSGTVGWEMNRNAAWHSFLQLDVSQPAVAAWIKGTFPGPLAELSIGAGF